MYFLRSHLTIPLRPRFQLFPGETDSLQSCVCCHGKIIDFICCCACGSCVYCSNKCQLNDFDEHKIRCDKIVIINREINELVDDFNLEHSVPPVTCHQQNNLFEFGIDENDCVMRQWSGHYFLKRQRLVEALVCEGLARIDNVGSGTIVTNKFALDIAINECRNLFYLDKFDSYYSRADGLLPKKEILMNLYLVSGKYQELYNLCCFYAKHGERYFSHFSSKYIGDIGSPFLLTNQDVTKSFFQDNVIHHDNFPVVALNHMYVMKQILHEQMEGLRLINSHFLNSQDCVSTIGEYLGLKQEWIVLEKDWYSDQALEIVLPFDGCKATCAEFGKLYGFSELFFSVDHLQRKAGMIADFPHIHTTRHSIVSWFQPEVSIVNIGSYTASFSSCFASLSTRALQLQPSQCDANYLPMWEETLRLCVEDHNYVCDHYIGHRFQAAVAKLNEIAGYDALSMNINHLAWTKPSIVQFYTVLGQCPMILSRARMTDLSKISHGYPSPKFVITQFVRNAIEICQKNPHDDYSDLYQFDQFIDYMDECEEGTLQLEYNSQLDFTYGIMIALVLERKIAQARYYISLLNGDADALLEKLPNGNNFRRVHPPPLHPNDPFPRQPFYDKLSPDISDRIKLVSRWLTDVTDLIDALFKAGLATNENLSIIFGDYSIVSNTLWDLRTTKAEMSQQRLSSNKSSLFPLYIATGLDIQSLSLAERTQRLEEARDATANTQVSSMKPSIAEFQEKFGLDCLGSAGFRCLDIIKAHTDKEFHDKVMSDCTLSKTPRGKEFELCDFDSLEEACRHFFDTSTLAAAILDCVGIPRLLIMNGDEKTMWQSGWKFKGRCALGDTSLQTGRRVALAIDGRLCSHHGAQNFWGECRSTPYYKEAIGNVLPPAEICDATHLNDLRFKVGEKVQAYVENDDALAREMIVDMSGIPEINGIYDHVGYHDRVPKYTKRCFYNGKHVEFSLFRCKLTDSTRRWYISIVPMNSHPGTTEDINFYVAKPSSEDDSLPPRHNWMCIPNFKCHGMTLRKRRQSPSPEVYPKTFYDSDDDSIIGEFVDAVVIMRWDDGNAYRVELEDDKRSHVWAPEDKDMYIRAQRMDKGRTETMKSEMMLTGY